MSPTSSDGKDAEAHLQNSAADNSGDSISTAHEESEEEVRVRAARAGARGGHERGLAARVAHLDRRARRLERRARLARAEHHARDEQHERRAEAVLEPAPRRVRVVERGPQPLGEPEAPRAEDAEEQVEAGAQRKEGAGELVEADRPLVVAHPHVVAVGARRVPLAAHPHDGHLHVLEQH